MVKIIKLGSLYLDDSPFAAPVGSSCLGAKISLGDTSPGNELQWVRWRGKLVANHCICIDVSWNFLNRQGYVYGRPVVINGKGYSCRCLKTIGGDSEWDAILAECGDSEDLWHCKERWFWGQEPHEMFPDRRIVRGYADVRHRGSCKADTHNGYIGFRPILEPLGPALHPSDKLIGHSIKAWMSGNTCIVGRLMKVDEYDLVLENAAVFGPDCACAKHDGTCIVLERESIFWLEELEK